MNEPQPLDTKVAAGLISPLYRDALVVITAAHDGKLNGQVALAALPASIVVEYPRVLIELWQNNLTHDLVRDSGAFCLHLVRPDQAALIRTFGFYHGHDRNKFADLAYNLGESGSPRLDDCLGWLDCRLIGQLPTEDMTAFVGEVIAARRFSDEQPLTWTEARKTLPKEWLDEYNNVIRRDNEAWAKERLEQGK